MRITDLTPQQLREFIQQNNEGSYLLIDVRQPGEYELAHIPGARLLPLPKLVQTVDTLPGDMDLVFYCHNGGRSMAAATMAEEEQRVGRHIYNLTGGMMAWDGAASADFPKVQLFRPGATSQQLMETAMNLEKGALRFYTKVASQFDGEAWSSAFAKLAVAEKAHAKMVYGHWRELQDQSQVDAFETLFDSMQGEVLEGGMPLEDAMARIGEFEHLTCVRLMELALQIEYAAFDLYRTMADQSLSQEARQTFIQLSQAEKAHMRTLAQATEACAG